MIDVSCAIIIKDYKILAAQRSPHGKLPLKWEFPGGKVEKNESIRESLIREIKEELNIEIEIKEALTPVEYAYPDFSIRLHPFVCQYIGGVMEKREHHQILWAEYSELWDLDWAEADKPIVKELMEVNTKPNQKFYFRFREHPGDMLRGTLIQEFPDPENDFEDFLVQFLPCYQRDDQVAYLDDLCKLLDDEFEFEEDKIKFIEYCELTEPEDIKREISEVEADLKLQAYENFYNLVRGNKIEILESK